MGIGDAIILGIVQGLTEFVPISSTGHLILARQVLGIPLLGSLMFDALLHLATAFAIIVYFWRDILSLIQHPTEGEHRILIAALIVGTIPAAVVGALMSGIIERNFRSPWIVIGALIFGSLLFIYAERQYNPRKTLTSRHGFWVGLFQTLALIPGMSRSGSSIAGGLLLGLSREGATKFSFLLGIPILCGVGVLKLFELIDEGVTDAALWPVIAGTVVAFVVGLGAIHAMVRFIKSHTLYPFAIYRIVLALLTILLLLVF